MDHYFEILLDFSNTVYLSIADAKVVDISIPANISNTFFQKKQTNDSKNLEINNIKSQLFFHYFRARYALPIYSIISVGNIPCWDFDFAAKSPAKPCKYTPKIAASCGKYP